MSRKTSLLLLTGKEARARRQWTPWMAAELSEATRLLLNQLGNPEEIVMVVETAVIGVKEAEGHHQETNASSAEELATGPENVQKTGTMTEAEVEIEAEEAIETAGQEKETKIEDKADASLVVEKDILQETAVEMIEMIQEIEEEVHLTETEIIKELDYQSALLQVTLNLGPKVRSKMIVTIDIKEPWTEWTRKKIEAVEVEDEENPDLHLTADLAHIVETEEAKEVVNSTNEEEAEVKTASTKTKREITPTQDHFQDQPLYAQTTRALINPQEAKLEMINLKEIE